MQQRILKSVNSMLIEILAARLQNITKLDEDDNKKVSKQIEINSKEKLIRKQQIKVRKYLKQYLPKLKVEKLNEALKT